MVGGWTLTAGCPKWEALEMPPLSAMWGSTFTDAGLILSAEDVLNAVLVASLLTFPSTFDAIVANMASEQEAERLDAEISSLKQQGKVFIYLFYRC